MTRLENIANEVAVLYGSQLPGREPWADWLYQNHVIVVRKNAELLAEKYNGNSELAQVAALLHDVADYKMPRADLTHEQTSIQLAREIVVKHGFSENEQAIIIDDAIRYHSCHGDERPKSVEGLILATADSLAHLQTDFYIYAAWAFGKDRSLTELKHWTLQKIDRDLFNKISFDDERRAATHDYTMIKELFSR